MTLFFPEKFTLEKFTSRNSHQRIHPRIRAEKFTLHFCRAILLIVSGNRKGNRKRWRQTGLRQSTAPPLRRYGPDTEIRYRPWILGSHTDLQASSRILSKREADTEFQHRPHIVDPDTIADAVLRTPLLRLRFFPLFLLASSYQRKIKGQQLKGQIVSEFSHFLALFRTFSEFIPQDFPLQNKGF